MKISFDLAKSLKLSPPKYPKGVKFINRLILNRDKVQFNKENQTYRVQVNLETAVPQLKDSYTAKGFIYTKFFKVKDYDLVYLVLFLPSFNSV